MEMKGEKRRGRKEKEIGRKRKMGGGRRKEGYNLACLTKFWIRHLLSALHSNKSVEQAIHKHVPVVQKYSRERI